MKSLVFVDCWLNKRRHCGLGEIVITILLIVILTYYCSDMANGLRWPILTKVNKH